MDKREYCDRVLAVLRRADPDEKAGIRRELEGHIEDHACALASAGYTGEEAAERAVAAMGDPEEMGRELDLQYPAWWLVWTLLSRAAAALMILACFWSLIGIGRLGYTIDGIKARISPDYEMRLEGEAAVAPLDIRLPIGDDIVRVYAIGVGGRGGERMAGVATCAYDRLPGGIVSDSLLHHISLANERGETDRSGGGRGNYGVDYWVRYVAVQPGDKFVTLSYSRFGESFELELALPEGGSADG